MDRHWRKATWRRSTAVLAAGLIAAWSANAAATTTSAVPAKLVGKWTRKVTSADVKRTLGYGVPAGTICTLTIKKSGGALLHTNTIGDLGGTLVPAGGNRVHIRIGLSNPNVYTWRVTGRVLTLTKVKDAVGDRVAAMEGAWKRK